MRLEARVIEDGRTVTALVPLRTVMAFREAHDGLTINEAITNSAFEDWEPWICWHATEPRDDPRPIEEWIDAVDWCGVFNAPNVLDPSGGQENLTQVSSPESSSVPDAAGPSSSGSAKTSSRPSGSKSAAK